MKFHTSAYNSASCYRMREWGTASTFRTRTRERSLKNCSTISEIPGTSARYRRLRRKKRRRNAVKVIQQTMRCEKEEEALPTAVRTANSKERFSGSLLRDRDWSRGRMCFVFLTAVFHIVEAWQSKVLVKVRVAFANLCDYGFLRIEASSTFVACRRDSADCRGRDHLFAQTQRVQAGQQCAQRRGCCRWPSLHIIYYVTCAKVTFRLHIDEHMGGALKRNFNNKELLFLLGNFPVGNLQNSSIERKLIFDRPLEKEFLAI